MAGFTRLNKRFWLCLAGALASLAAGWFAPWLFISRDPGLSDLMWATALQEILLIGVPAAFIALKSEQSLTRLRTTLRRPDPVYAGLSMLGAVAFTMAGLLLTLLAYSVLETLGFPPDTPDAIIPSGIPELLVSILCAAIIPALCEELLFRGVLLSMLENKVGGRWASAITSVLFAGLHFTLLGFPVLLALGLLLARLMQRKQSLWLCVLFHAMYNLSILVINYSGSEPGFPVILFSCAIAWITIRILLKEEPHELPRPGM